MGYMRHHAIVVTTTDFHRDKLGKVLAKIGTDCSQVRITPVVESGSNSCLSFCVIPDGSKEGWPESDQGDNDRTEIKALLRSYQYADASSPFDWVEVQYGDDEYQTVVTDDSDRDIRMGDLPAFSERRGLGESKPVNPERVMTLPARIEALEQRIEALEQRMDALDRAAAENVAWGTSFTVTGGAPTSGGA